MNDALIVYNKNKTYTYEAIFVQKDGDTLTTENIVVQPTGEPWVQKTQTKFYIHYNTDSNFIHFVNPINARRKKFEKYKKIYKKKGEDFSVWWTKKSSTGAIESSKELWIHPFRDNQYVYTEVAPFPCVELDSLNIGGNWHSSLEIMLGWDNFKGTVKSDYTVVKNEDYNYGDVVLDSCWRINAIANHSTLGESKNNFLYHSEYGFVQQHLTLYDGTIISFKLIKVEFKGDSVPVPH
ncbi:hypothetical protein DNU06_15775 [Putridiphycobacter roseus]|uniref:Uncharacterized protein n=2 Tax=Putridiphycobacter roseus TaxID=2219161 RepID=A0A2W1NMI1_9FLAO|nr:hypothetical protein DNU06_15775 [Putridiphycobacter roseus]